MSREITSTANPFVKQLRALMNSKKERQTSGRFIVEGWRGIKTLLEHKSNQYTLETLVLSSSWDENNALPETTDTVYLPQSVFDTVSDVNNAQGILGVVRHNPLPFNINPTEGNYLLLDHLRDPGNLGTLIRSSVGAGFDGVLLYGECVELFNPKVIRSTMGTFAFSPVWNIGDTELEQFLTEKYDLLVTTGAGGENLYTTGFGKKNILAIGSEAHGISDALMQKATHKINIPLKKECESLNAAIAGSICMFHMKNA